MTFEVPDLSWVAVWLWLWVCIWVYRYGFGFLIKPPLHLGALQSSHPELLCRHCFLSVWIVRKQTISIDGLMEKKIFLGCLFCLYLDFTCSSIIFNTLF